MEDPFCYSMHNLLRNRELGCKNFNFNVFSKKYESPSKILCSSSYLIQKYSKLHELSGHTGCVNSTLFTDDGHMIITGSDDTLVKYYDVYEGKLLRTVNTAHTLNIFFAKEIEFSCGNRLLTCAADGLVLLTDVNGKSGSNSTEVFEHNGRAHRIALVPGAPDCFLSTGEDGNCKYFDVRLPKHNQIVSEVDFIDSIYSLSINPIRNSEVLLGGGDSQAAIYDIRMLKVDVARRSITQPLCYLAPDHLIGNDFVHLTGVQYNYNGSEALLSYNDENIYTLDIERHSRTKRESRESDADIKIQQAGDMGILHRGMFDGHRNSLTVKSVTYLGPRSEFVCSGSDCGHVFIWDSQSGNDSDGTHLLTLLDADSRGAVNCLSPHPTLPLLTTSGLSHTAKVWAPIGEHRTLNGVALRRNAADTTVLVNNDDLTGCNPSEPDSDDEVAQYNEDAYNCIQNNILARTHAKQRYYKRRSGMMSASDLRMVLRRYYISIPMELIDMMVSAVRSDLAHEPAALTRRTLRRVIEVLNHVDLHSDDADSDVEDGSEDSADVEDESQDSADVEDGSEDSADVEDGSEDSADVEDGAVPVSVYFSATDNSEMDVAPSIGTEDGISNLTQEAGREGEQMSATQCTNQQTNTEEITDWNESASDVEATPLPEDVNSSICNTSHRKRTYTDISDNSSEDDEYVQSSDMNDVSRDSDSDVSRNSDSDSSRDSNDSMSDFLRLPSTVQTGVLVQFNQELRTILRIAARLED